MSRNVVLSFGAGIDSSAVLARWLTDPSSRDFELSALTMIVAQVGDEYPDTYQTAEQALLPMLRARGVRLVQVARPALATGGGKRYVVLDDTAAPRRLVRAGPVRLSDELARNGTIAQVSNRRCIVDCTKQGKRIRELVSVDSLRSGDGSLGHEQGQFLNQLVHALAGLSAHQCQGQFGEQAEAAGLGARVTHRFEELLGAGEVAAVLGSDDACGLLSAEEDRPGARAHGSAGPRTVVALRAGAGHGATMSGLPAARAASNRLVTSAQLTRFHSRST
ncbi:hypothetical protein BDK92_2611 [Micromonospora pisi]|uniref:Uncharacterized protein n=1 Tax=Micromonospora pisi TaxID=589240 RepID=A0A495JGZ1_9ACTN|nr:hypothetical protein BDK92_2611 [Micromonospora pisi]